LLLKRFRVLARSFRLVGGLSSFSLPFRLILPRLLVCRRLRCGLNVGSAPTLFNQAIIVLDERVLLRNGSAAFEDLEVALLPFRAGRFVLLITSSARFAAGIALRHCIKAADRRRIAGAGMVLHSGFNSGQVLRPSEIRSEHDRKTEIRSNKKFALHPIPRSKT
jgi:hypothetical protein